MATYQSSPPSSREMLRKNLLGFLFGPEPVMFLFMCSALAKFPVFQSLLFEKACLNSGRFNASACGDINATHADVGLQREANHLLLASSFCLLLPSVPSGLMLGASDKLHGNLVDSGKLQCLMHGAAESR